MRKDIKQIAERVRRAHKIPEPTKARPQVTSTARALGISRNEWKKILTGKQSLRGDVERKILEADKEARLQSTGQKPLTTDRKRRMMIGVLEAMSDAAIEDQFHQIMQAGASDLTAVFGDEPGNRSGGVGSFTRKL